MEASAMHNFIASCDDELSFSKGAIIKLLVCFSFQLGNVFNTNKEMTGWCKAELKGKEGEIPINYVTFHEPSWFYGNITRGYAEKLLMPQKKGAFLIRESESTPGDFSLSVKASHGVRHYKVLRDRSGKYFIWLVKFTSLNNLVDYHETSSVSRLEKLILKKGNLQQVRALYDFEPQDNTDLQFQKGDIIVVTGKPDRYWWTGIIGEREGMIPVSYVQIVNQK